MSLIEIELKPFNIISPLLYENGLKIGGVPNRITQQFNMECEIEKEWPKSTIIELSQRIILFFKDVNFIQFGELVLPKFQYSNLESDKTFPIFSCKCVKGNIMFRYLEEENDNYKRIDIFLVK